MPDAPTNRIGLSRGQTVLLVVIGAALWFLAAIILRLIAPMGALEGSARLITYALVIPGTLPFVMLTRMIVKLRSHQLFTGVGVVTMTALLIDGVVIAWFPAVYGGALPQVTNCAAAILWGAGVGLVLAFILNKGEAA
ncbi:MAG: hypothetical protein IBJ12_06615 [Sphingomonadaceae bacterium]|nr:hypothetical protein [Sphingomonadaceae bacterium]